MQRTIATAPFFACQLGWSGPMSRNRPDTDVRLAVPDVRMRRHPGEGGVRGEAIAMPDAGAARGL